MSRNNGRLHKMHVGHAEMTKIWKYNMQRRKNRTACSTGARFRRELQAKGHTTVQTKQTCFHGGGKNRVSLYISSVLSVFRSTLSKPIKSTRLPTMPQKDGKKARNLPNISRKAKKHPLQKTRKTKRNKPRHNCPKSVNAGTTTHK